MAGHEALRQAARVLLDATDAVAADARGRAEVEDAAGVWVAAAARDAAEGWPARLSNRWLREAFRGQPAVAGFEVTDLPVAVGAASFVRGFASYGEAARRAMAPAAMPFALAHDPAFASAHRFGFVFGALGADPELHGRLLGLGRAAARAQARKLVPTLLLECRTVAARLLLGDDALGDTAAAHLFAEITERLFGSPLDERLCGAWPPPRGLPGAAAAVAGEEPARFVGLLEAPRMRRTLVERFEPDWFRNPRAWAHLGELSHRPAHEPLAAEELPKLARDLARELEEAAG
jgi:hypothetical protein